MSKKLSLKALASGGQLVYAVYRNTKINGEKKRKLVLHEVDLHYNEEAYSFGAGETLIVAIDGKPRHKASRK